MIIGLDLIGSSIFKYGIHPSTNINHVELSNLVAREMHIKNTDYDSTENEPWGMGTVLLARFDGDLEAGNITAGENPITHVRIKRRNFDNMTPVIVDDIPFNPDPTLIVYDDYLAISNRDYEYQIVPVDEAGIEGVINSVYISPNFEGWWLVDLEEPEKYNFQFLFNLDDTTIATEEDRTELKTFRKYPMIRYGQTRFKKGTLAGLFIPDGIDVRKHLEYFDKMLERRKPLLLKDKYGRGYLVDVSSPQETVQARLAGLARLQVSWQEVGEYSD